MAQATVPANSYGNLAQAVTLSNATELHIKEDMVYNGVRFVDLRKFVRGRNRACYTADGVAIPEDKVKEVIEKLTAVAVKRGLM